MIALPDLDEMLARVARHDPVIRDTGSGFRAATALILTREPDPRMLVIERATRDGDRWSGHAALPGGKHDPTDPDILHTARRETREEVGIDLAEPVGRLDDLGGHSNMGVVSTFVFTLEEALPPVPEPGEVAAALWVPVRVLVDPASRGRHPSRRVGPWPAFVHEHLVIWGLTHRTLTGFAAIAGLGD